MQKNISAQKECALESISKKNLIETFTLNEEKKVNNKKNSKPLPTIDYTKFEDIYGAPRINDKIAFQVVYFELLFKLFCCSKSMAYLYLQRS